MLYEHPESEVTIFYIDLQVMGKGFRQTFRGLEGRLRLIQGVPSEVLETEGKEVALVFEDMTDGKVKTEPFDLVVLAVGMTPGQETAGLAGLLQVPLEKRGFLTKMAGQEGSRLYTLGACRAPMDIPGARRQAMDAVGGYLASLGF